MVSGSNAHTQLIPGPKVRGEGEGHSRPGCPESQFSRLENGANDPACKAASEQCTRFHAHEQSPGVPGRGTAAQLPAPAGVMQVGASWASKPRPLLVPGCI